MYLFVCAYKSGQRFPFLHALMICKEVNACKKKKKKIIDERKSIRTQTLRPLKHMQIKTHTLQG